MRRTALTLSLLTVGTALAGPVMAADVTIGAITISDPWARATAPTAPTGAAYFTLTTSGDQPDRLTLAASPAADLVELHTVSMDSNGVMRMRPVEAIEIAPNAPTALAPGGLHIMLIGLTGPLIQGESFPLTLTFEEAGSVDIAVPIAAAGASSAPDTTD